jgi:hypothetical protein
MTANQLEELPESFTRLASLYQFNFQSNRLRTLRQRLALSS